MRIYSGLVEAHNEIQRDLFEVGEWVKGATVQDKDVLGDEAFDFMELRPYIYTLTRWADRDDYIDRLELSSIWIQEEFKERVNKQSLNPGSAWAFRHEVWKEFLQRNDRFSYTYSERFHLGNQFHRVFEELRIRPNTRQAVIAIFNPILDTEKMGGFQRIPCSLSYQFLVRNGQLEIIYSMRSCDFFTHFPYDQLLAIQLLERMGTRLNRTCSRFTHIIGSLHGFRKDFPEGIF